MKGILRKSLLVGVSALMLVGCVSESFVKDLLQTAQAGYVAQLPRGDETIIKVPLMDRGHYNAQEEVVYSFTFNREQRTDWYTLSGEFAGKTVASALYDDEHTVYLTFAGKSTTGSTGVVFGTLTINQAAFASVEDQYKGAKIMVTLALGDEAGQAER